MLHLKESSLNPDFFFSFFLSLQYWELNPGLAFYLWATFLLIIKVYFLWFLCTFPSCLSLASYLHSQPAACAVLSMKALGGILCFGRWLSVDERKYLGVSFNHTECYYRSLKTDYYCAVYTRTPGLGTTGAYYYATYYSTIKPNFCSEVS